jgi:hypothetical protein
MATDFIQQFSALVGEVYETALTGADWTRFAESAARTFDARIAGVLTGLPSSADSAGPGIEFKFADVPFQVDYDGPNITVDRVWRRPRGSVSAWQNMSRDSGFRRTEYYAAVKKRNRIEHALIVVTEPVADLANLLFLTRDVSQVEFPKPYLESFADLAAHFHRAMRLARHRIEVATANPLDRFQCAAFIVDSSGTIVRENELGFMLLRSDDAMARGGRLRLGGGLEAALARIGVERSIASPSFFDVERPESGGTLAAMVAAAPIEIANGSSGSLALVLLSDPNRFVCPPAWSLRQEFGLTSAEARFVISFVRSKGIREAARQLGIRWETGRRHLKSVFEKTHTHSQVELTHLLLKHPASVLGEFSAPY